MLHTERLVNKNCVVAKQTALLTAQILQKNPNQTQKETPAKNTQTDKF